MTLLILGLVIFIGVHSVRIVADGVRSAVIAKHGVGLWKGLFALTSAVGLTLIIVGYGQPRGGTPLLAASTGARHAAYALVWLGFVGVTAAYWPRNYIKRFVGEPMVGGVGLWALGHLLVKSTPAALALFGAFLSWALIDFVSLRARAAAVPAVPIKPTVLHTLLTVVVGSAVWTVFALFVHKVLIGISPLA